MIVSESITDISTPTGPMRAYLYSPRQPERPERPRPGLLLYSEIFQQTSPVRRLAISLASFGYLVALPEVYHAHEPPGTVLGYDDAGKERGNSLKGIIPMRAFDDDAYALVQALKRHPDCNGRLGTLGICLGGHLAFRAALLPDVSAAACFYPTDLHSGNLGLGGNADSLRRVGDIRGELLMVFGRQDPHVPADGRRIIHDALEKAGVFYSWHEFNAVHAFARDEGDRFDAECTRAATGLALDMFRRAL